MDIARRYVDLKRNGPRWVAPCPFHQETKPSFSVNEEQGLFYCFGCHASGDIFDFYGRINGLDFRDTLEQLAAEGKYRVGGEILKKLQDLFWAGSCGEAETLTTIHRYFEEQNYLIDTHTAVAANVLAQYRTETGDMRPAVFASTASPYKFCSHVLEAIGEEPWGEGVELLEQLNEASGVKIPERLAALGRKEVRFTQSTEKQNMEQVVLDYLK